MFIFNFCLLIFFSFVIADDNNQLGDLYPSKNQVLYLFFLSDTKYFAFIYINKIKDF